MSIERPNPRPEGEPVVILHMQHASYFGYAGNDDLFRVVSVSEAGTEELLETEEFNDVVTLIVEAAADA